MTSYNGKLHETVCKFPNTDIWNDSCALDELEYAIERGAVGATTNPVIVGAVLKKELPLWKDTILKLIEDMPTATEEDIAWALIEAIAQERSKLLLPVYQKFAGKKGRLSIQTNAKYYRDPAKMTEQAVHFNALAPNMQVKIPASKAGIEAYEEATYRGVSINATVSFTLPQAIAVAEAVERGLKRREAEGLKVDDMAPVCTLMVGRLDDWMKDVVNRDNIILDPVALDWAGIAVFKKAYKIYNERGYRTRLLSAAYRNHLHWSELIGGEVSMTITSQWQKRFNVSDVEVKRRIDDEVNPKYVEEMLAKIPDFKKAYTEDGITPEDFEKYGAFVKTITSFLAGYDELLVLIRGFMLPNPLKK